MLKDLGFFSDSNIERFAMIFVYQIKLIKITHYERTICEYKKNTFKKAEQRTSIEFPAAKSDG